jgi:putative transposase
MIFSVVRCALANFVFAHTNGESFMPYNPNIHRRRSIRIKGYDYSQTDAYFITVCTQRRICLFGDVEDQLMHRNEAGDMIAATWAALPQRFPTLALDAFVVMPNHIHGILVLTENVSATSDPAAHEDMGRSSQRSNRPRGTLPGTIGRIVQAFKSISTHTYIHGVEQRGWLPFPGRLWQRDYYERVIRDDTALAEMRMYIDDNPMRWAIHRDNLNVALKK